MGDLGAFVGFEGFIASGIVSWSRKSRGIVSVNGGQPVFSNEANGPLNDMPFRAAFICSAGSLIASCYC